MLAGLKEKAASVHVSILGEQDLRAREELELREKEWQPPWSGSTVSPGWLQSAGTGAGPPAVLSFMDSTDIHWMTSRCQALSGYWRHRVNKTKSLALFYCSQIDSSTLCLTSLSLKGSLSPNKPNWLSPGHQPSKVRSYKPDTLCWPHQWWPFTGVMCQGSCQAPYASNLMWQQPGSVWLQSSVLDHLPSFK